MTTKELETFQRALLEKRGAVVHIAESGSELARWLRRGHTAGAIVRPDRTVMCAGRNLNALCEAVPQFVSSELAQPANPSGLENVDN